MVPDKAKMSPLLLLSVKAPAPLRPPLKLTVCVVPVLATVKVLLVFKVPAPESVRPFVPLMVPVLLAATLYAFAMEKGPVPALRLPPAKVKGPVPIGPFVTLPVELMPRLSVPAVKVVPPP